MSTLTAYGVSQRHEVLWVIWVLGLWGLVGTLGLVTISMALTIHPISNNVAVSIRVLIGMAALLAWMQGHLVAQSLARAAQVLGQRQVPHRLWTDWLRLLFTQTARTWCIVAVACIFVLSPVGTPWRWPTGAALVSLAMALSMTRTLSNRGLLPAALDWCIAGGLIVGALVISVTIGLGGALDAFSRWPDWLQLLLIAVSPAMAISLHRRWASAVPRLSRPSVMTSAVVWPWLKREFKRYTPLSYFVSPSYRESSKDPMAPVITIIVISIANGPQLHKIVGAWGSTLELWHPLFLISMIVMCSPNLIGKDLHWRMLLAPGGLHRGRLGFYVFRSTVEYFFGFCIAMLMFAWTTSQLVPGLPALDVFALIQRYALLPLQLLFAISVASCLLAAPRPSWAFAGLVVLLLAGAATYAAYHAALPAPPPWFKAGPGYVAILLILTLAAIALSNCLWTVQKLMGAAAPLPKTTA